MWFCYEAEIYCQLSVANDSKVSPQNFRALGKPQAKLCLLEVRCMYKTPFRKSGHNL